MVMAAPTKSDENREANMIDHIRKASSESGELTKDTLESSHSGDAAKRASAKGWNAREIWLRPIC